MLAKSFRLTTKELEKAIDKGGIAHSPFFILRFLNVKSERKNSAHVAKFAVIASKKVAKTAVLRHAVRRKVFNALRPITPGVKKGYYIVLFVKSADKKFMDMASDDLTDHLDAIFKKVRIAV